MTSYAMREALVDLCMAMDLDPSKVLETQRVGYGSAILSFSYDENAEQCVLVVNLGKLPLGADDPRHGAQVAWQPQRVDDVSCAFTIDPELNCAMWVLRIPWRLMETGTSFQSILAVWVDPALDAWQALLAPHRSATEIPRIDQASPADMWAADRA